MFIEFLKAFLLFQHAASRAHPKCVSTSLCYLNFLSGPIILGVICRGINCEGLLGSVVSYGGIHSCLAPVEDSWDIGTIRESLGINIVRDYNVWR